MLYSFGPLVRGEALLGQKFIPQSTAQRLHVRLFPRDSPGSTQSVCTA